MSRIGDINRLAELLRKLKLARTHLSIGGGMMELTVNGSMFNSPTEMKTFVFPTSEERDKEGSTTFKDAMDYMLSILGVGK